MSLINLPTNNIEAKKLQFEALLAEYNAMRSIIERYRSAQGQLDNIALAGLGLSIPVILFVIDKNFVTFGAILLLPILFFAISFTQIHYSRMISRHAFYIDSVISLKMNTVLSQLDKNAVPLLEYENFLFRTGAKTLFLAWLGMIFSSGITLAIALGLTLIHLIVRINTPNILWHTYEVGLIALNLILLSINLGYAYYIARTYIQYFKRYTAR